MFSALMNSASCLTAMQTAAFSQTTSIDFTDNVLPESKVYCMSATIPKSMTNILAQAEAKLGERETITKHSIYR